MNYLDNIHKCKNLDELFQIWKSKPIGEISVETKKSEYRLTVNHPNDTFIADGIVNPEIWEDGLHKKILFVLKEAYGEGWDSNTLVSWLRKYHPKSIMWERVAKWVYGLQNTSANHIEKYTKNLTDEKRGEALEQIAVMNLKKSNGTSTSEYDIIKAYAEFDKEELRKEFEMINADIVVCGYTFGILYNTVYENPPLTKNENWYYFLNLGGRKRLFIDYYHPANHYPDLINYYGLVGIYQQALIAEGEKTND